MANKEWRPFVKVVLYGKEGVGKSTLMMKYVYGRFDFNIESTIGSAFNSKLVLVDGVALTLQIWDTAGSERFNSIMPMYLRGSKIVLLCFEDPNISEIEARIAKVFEAGLDIKIFLVATKVDLPDRANYEHVVKYAEEHNYGLYYTSSLTGSGVEDLFAKVARVALKIAKKEALEVKPISLPLTPVRENKSQCCFSS